MQRIHQITGFSSNGSATKRAHTMRLLAVGLVWLAALHVGGGEAAAAMRQRRSATADDHYAYADGAAGTAYDRININYDEYPMIVPKRAALLLDRLMVALHHALEDGDQEGVRRINDLYRQQTTKAPPSPLPLPRAGSSSSNSNNGGAEWAANSKQTPAKFVQSYRFDGVADDLSGYADRSADARPKQQKQQMNEEMMGMQRRGHGGEALGASKGHVYWRCYFNAVSCF